MSGENQETTAIDQFTEQLERIAINLKKVNGTVSWLTMPADHRKTLTDAFLQVPVVHLAMLLGKDDETIKRWQDEARRVDEVLKKITIHQNQAVPCALNRNQDVVDSVLELTKWATPIKIAQAMENRLTEGTIRRWMRERAGIVEKKIFVKSASSTSPVEPTGDLPEERAKVKGVTGDDINVNISESTDGRKLAAMILRHQGKKRWKYSSTEKRLIAALANQYGSKSVHDTYHIAYDTISRLRRRSEEGFDLKPRVPLKYAPVLELMNKHPGMGPMQVRDHIRRHMGLLMGVNSVRNVMEQNGWVPPFARTSRIKDAMRHFEAVRKNYMWHLDFKHHFINQSKVAILSIQDDYSRFIVGHSYGDSENMDTVINALEESIAVNGKPEVIMTDGGSAFYSWRGVSAFTRLLEDHGIDHYIAKSANINGKIESVCLQVEKELLNTQTFSSLSHFEKQLSAWVGFYNFKRPHSGLGDCHVPADRFYPGAAHWFSTDSELTKQKSLIAETMATLLNELKKSS